MTKKALRNKQSLSRQVWHFIIHLRWHYQVGILSGGFLMGGYLSPDIIWPSFLLQFANVHLLLFGGATAFNSFWDKDRGPVGGLKQPPPVRPWMRPVSLLLPVPGLLIAWQAGWVFTAVYGVSMLFFWLYSTPRFRWKGKPLRSLAAIGISTGSNSLLMGYTAAGHSTAIDSAVWMAALGVSLIILSLYPVSQLFQLDADQARGDKTFALTYGLAGVIRFFKVAYLGGLLLLGFSIAQMEWRAGVFFLIAGAVAGGWIYRQLLILRLEPTDYPRVMRIKYVASLSFVSFIIVLFIDKHLI